MNPALRFVEAVNGGDLERLAGAFHPDFEMVVPQHPARGFKGRQREVETMRHLIETHPNGRIEVTRMVETPSEVWMESNFRAEDLEIAAVVIFEIDRDTDTIRVGRYYSEEVDRESPDMDKWIRSLGPVEGAG
jgi:hypothetical protein